MDKKKKSSAKFIVFLDAAEANPLLFDDGRRWVGKVIENDGYIVDTLLATARACPLPDEAMLSGLQPPPPPGCSACCFELH